MNSQNSAPQPNGDESANSQPAARGEVTGLPTDLPPGSRVALIDGGRQVAIAAGTELTTYDLSPEGDSTLAAQRCRHIGELPGEVTALAEGALGLIVAVRSDCDGDHILHVDPEGDPVVIHESPAQITSLAASGGDAYAVTAGPMPSVVRVSVRQRATVDRTTLTHSDIRVEPRDNGGLLMVDRREGTTRMLARDLREEQPAADAPATCPCQERSTKSPCGCRPARERDCGCRDPHDPPADDTPGRPIRTPDDGPGTSVAVPTPDGGVVVGRGDRVEHQPPGGSRLGPCGRSLFYSVDALHRVGAYYLASDAGGRTMTLLSSDMNIVDEWFAGRRGSVVLNAPNTTRMLPFAAALNGPGSTHIWWQRNCGPIWGGL